MKKILLVLVSLLLVGCSEQSSNQNVTTGTSKSEVVTTKVEEEKGLGLVRVESADILEMMDSKETFVMYLGTTYCSHCQEYKPHLEEVFLPDHPSATIYYVELDESDTDATNTLATMVGLEYTPTTFLIINGEIMDSYVGNGHDDTLEKMLGSIKKN